MSLKTQSAAGQFRQERQIFPSSEMSSFLPHSETILGHQAKSLFNRDDRSNFYAGGERLTLTAASLAKVRQLHEANDCLQRQIANCEKGLGVAADPLSVHAEIEHCHLMIARNTGEILNIYSMNESRLRRIAELEAQNLQLEKNMVDSQGLFISTRDMNQRTQHAIEFFLNKSTFERNTEELRNLSKE